MRWGPLPASHAAKDSDKVLVIVNPFGGRGDGTFVLEKVIRPMLTIAGIPHDVILTSRHGEATEIGTSLAHRSVADRYRAVMLYSGDGTLHELMNGIGRVDPRLLSATPFVMLPGGSSNCAVSTVSDASPCVDVGAVLTRCLTTTRAQRVDVIRATYPGCAGPLYDPFVCSFALIADHDLLQEGKLRFLGPAIKNVYCPLHVIVTRGIYPAKIFMRPAPQSLLHSTHKPATALPLADPKEVASAITMCAAPVGSPLPPVDPAPLPWRVLEDDIVVMCASILPRSGVDAKITPYAGADDGCLDAIIIRGGVSRYGLLQVFLGLEKGTHVELPFVEVYKVREMILVPKGPLGSWSVNLSGERVFPPECTAVHLSVLQGAALFAQ